jgi:uridine phosphorylase
MDEDYLYHLGLSKANAPCFKNIKYVCIGGTNDRMTNFAELCGKKFGFQVNSIGIHKRYVLYKVGPCLICSHGMGGPSISILLNEIAKLLKYAEADALWIRMGTCGGIGVSPGTLCISSQSLNGALEPYHETIVLGQKIRREAIFDEQVAKDLAVICSDLDIDSVIGKTMCCDDFYEGQGRLDGAICEYTEQDKLTFLERAAGLGVKNIEMESLQFGAFCNKIGVRSIVVCVAILNRLNGDQVRSTMDELKAFEERPVEAVIEFIRRDFITAQVQPP